MNIVIAASDSGDNRKGWQIYVAWIQAINDHSKRTCSLHTALSCLTCRGWATQTIKRLLCVEKWCGLQVFYYVRGVCREMMWSASVLLRARSVSRNDVVCKCFITCEECVNKWCGLQVFYYVRGVCQEMMWSASVLLRARSVSRNDVVCKCFITCEECVKKWCGLQVFSTLE
jgi:hypothetical protein